MVRRSLPVLVAAVSAAVLLAGCSGSAKPGGTVTEYVDPSVPPSTSAAPSTSASSSPSTSTLASPASMSKLPGTCDDELPAGLVSTTVGQALPGNTAFVVGQPDPSIHRVTYINCRYGLSDPNATPMIEIQVSLYGTDAQASARISPTVTDYQGHGASARQTTVNGVPATILTGGTGAGYDTATLVLAFGQRTVAVSLSNQIASDKQNDDLSKLAALALKQTQ